MGWKKWIQGWSEASVYCTGAARTWTPLCSQLCTVFTLHWLCNCVHFVHKHGPLCPLCTVFALCSSCTDFTLCSLCTQTWSPLCSVQLWTLHSLLYTIVSCTVFFTLFTLHWNTLFAVFWNSILSIAQLQLYYSRKPEHRVKIFTEKLTNTGMQEIAILQCVKYSGEHCIVWQGVYLLLCLKCPITLSPHLPGPTYIHHLFFSGYLFFYFSWIHHVSILSVDFFLLPELLCFA